MAGEVLYQFHSLDVLEILKLKLLSNTSFSTKEKEKEQDNSKIYQFLSRVRDIIAFTTSLLLSLKALMACSRVAPLA